MSKRKTAKSSKVVASIIPSKSFVASKAVTAPEILTEAAGLGTNYQRVTVPTVDMLAEAREMMLARGDVGDLVLRKFEVTDAMFERVAVLADLLGPRSVRSEAPRNGPAMTGAAEVARGSLSSIREHLALLGDAAGFDASLFAVDTRRYNLFVDSMAAVIGTVVALRHHLPDAAKVDALVAEANALIEMELASRLESAVLASRRVNNSKRVGQLKRLLFDQMRHISKQGLAAYRGDSERELWYGLERFNPAPSKKADPTAPEAPTALTDDSTPAE